LPRGQQGGSRGFARNVWAFRERRFERDHGRVELGIAVRVVGNDGA
jgi:hypothetical protein